MSQEPIPSVVDEANVEEVQVQEEDGITPVESNDSPGNLTELAFESGVPSSSSPQMSGRLTFNEEGEQSSMVCVLTVPGLMTAPDFCQFVLPFGGLVQRVRLLRRVGESNRYIAIMEFGTFKDAEQFCEAYEGREFFGGLIKERCRLKTVKRVEFSHRGRGSEDSHEETFAEMYKEEYGDCAVCLEKMNRDDPGLVTTICHHVMHLKCLSKWDLNTCPVCRYRHELMPEGSVCITCNSPHDVWMCLVCGNVACGRMNAQHAQEHFQSTNHPFAVNLSDTVFWSGDKVKAGSVWDYISERFINRLLNTEDGKVVEVSRNRSPEQSDRCGASQATPVDEVEEAEDRQVQAAVYASRMEAIVAEYRLTIESLKLTHRTEMRRREDQLGELEARNATLSSELSALEQKMVSNVKERKSLAKKLNEMKKQQEQQTKETAFLKKMYETLLRDKAAWAQKVETLEKNVKKEREEKVALEEQLRDMMLHMELQKRIEGAAGCGTEVSGGAVLGVGDTPKERLRKMRGKG